MSFSAQFDLEKIKNLQNVVHWQFKKIDTLRSLVRQLQFIPVDTMGHYTAVSYKSMDGGMLGIKFQPFELDLISVADSNGIESMRFIVPKRDELKNTDFSFMDEFDEVKRFCSLFQVDSVLDTIQFLNRSEDAMETAEYCCILERMTRDKNDPLIIMKDGLLRTKVFKQTTKQKLWKLCREFKPRKLVGVTKTSQLLNLIATALRSEKIIPSDATGFIEIPLEIERHAYNWVQNIKYYPFGKLYVAKLSKKSDLLVTVEIPYDFEKDEAIYSQREISEIFGHLISDSKLSFPSIGYPQTLMKAHEKATQAGMVASIWRDKIIGRLLEQNDEFARMLKDANLLQDYVSKAHLGGV